MKNKKVLNWFLTNLKRMPVIKDYYSGVNYRPAYEKFEVMLWSDKLDEIEELSFNYDDDVTYVIGSILNVIEGFKEREK